MGLETKCAAQLNGGSSEGKAHCGDGLLEFRGEFRVSWKWSDLRVEARNGDLHARRGEEELILSLGEAASKWVHAIQNPRSRLDKLGVKLGQTWCLLGDHDADFHVELQNRTERSPTLGGEVNWAFVALTQRIDLSALLEARKLIRQDGGIWAIWPKGRKELNENHIREFALENGLVDVKVASFSAELSALKLVIPRNQRT